MTARSILAAALACNITLFTAAVRAQDRWVDDVAVEPLLSARATAGFGVGVLSYPGPSNNTLGLVGTGLNAAGALGVGRGFEVTARVGLRLDDTGRGLRADEVARGLETPTFGTGLSTLANPELGARWLARRWRWLELGAVDRFVFPTPSDPDITDIIGVWASAHVARIARADLDLEGVLSWQSFSAGYVLLPAFVAPLRLWVNLTRGLFAGLVLAPRYYGATQYTSSTLEMPLGAVIGYRIHACDTILGGYLIDVVNDGTDRTGAGLLVSCHLGRASR